MSYRFPPAWFAFISAAACALLCGCAVDSAAPGGPGGPGTVQVNWRLRPAQFAGIAEMTTCGPNRGNRFTGRVSTGDGELTVVMTSVGAVRGRQHLAVAYSWAGSQKIIYTHQPQWAITFIRDLHRVLQWPAKIGVIHTVRTGVQDYAWNCADGDVERLYFMGAADTPWRVMVSRPRGGRIDAWFYWGPNGRFRSLRLSDSAAGRTWKLVMVNRSRVE